MMKLSNERKETIARILGVKTVTVGNYLYCLGMTLGWGFVAIVFSRFLTPDTVSFVLALIVSMSVVSFLGNVLCIREGIKSSETTLERSRKLTKENAALHAKIQELTEETEELKKVIDKLREEHTFRAEVKEFEDVADRTIDPKIPNCECYRLRAAVMLLNSVARKPFPQSTRSTMRALKIRLKAIEKMLKIESEREFTRHSRFKPLSGHEITSILLLVNFNKEGNRFKYRSIPGVA